MRAAINGELFVTFPEGFRTMSADELRRIYATDFENMCGYWDEERHIIVTVTWNVSNKLITKLTNSKALAKRAEKHLARAYKSHGFHSDGLFATQLAGRDAHGVRYGYTVEGVAHNAEAIVFLNGACCYTLYYYTHADLADNNAAIRNEVFGTLSFA